MVSEINIGDTPFFWGKRTYVMGVLNVTPDSFSGDGVLSGKNLSPRELELAVQQALKMEENGADILDVGGESTRPASLYPGFKPVSAEEEIDRVLPVIQALKGKLRIPLSIDTRKAKVAEAAARENVALINDVSMLGDDDMALTAAKTGLPIVVSHNRADGNRSYSDTVSNVASELAETIKRAIKARVNRNVIIADPGIGFAKGSAHNLDILRRLHELKSRLEGLPILVGTSRKSFIGETLGLPMHERIEGTAATIAVSICNGADIVRVHDIRHMARIVQMTDAIVRGQTEN